MITDFLQKVKELPLSELSASEAVSKVKELKEEVLAKKNPYIEDVLARATRVH